MDGFFSYPCMNPVQRTSIMHQRTAASGCFVRERRHLQAYQSLEESLHQKQRSPKKDPKDATLSTIHCHKEKLAKGRKQQTPKKKSTTKTKAKRIVFNNIRSINHSSSSCFSKFGWIRLCEMRPKLLTYGVRATKDYVKLTAF